MKIVVIGAGLGGLSAACLLSSKGHDVLVIESNKFPGGKMHEVEKRGFRFDTGPSLFTMPFVLDKLLHECGTTIENELTLLPLDPLCRYFFSDGTTFDNYLDKEKNELELKKFAPTEIKAYNSFLNKAKQIYDKTASAFIFNPLFDSADFSSLNPLDLMNINAFSSVHKEVNKQFDSKYLRQFFKRFATYNGSSPYLAPGTLNVIPHVELNQGGYYVQGGIHSITEVLFNIAKQQGVKFKFNCGAKQIHCVNQVVKGVYNNKGKLYEADLVVANSDATYTYSKLLSKNVVSARKRKRIKQVEPSSSGFVMLLGVEKVYDQLKHHNVFFSSDYKHEFHQIFEDKVMPDDPTIYVANTSYSDPEHAPEGCSNLFVLVNAPYLSKRYKWKDHKREIANQVVHILEEKGLKNLKKNLVYRKIYTPKDFKDIYKSNKGSIYGTSSNSKLSAFVRPRNKSKEIKGLYFVGGSTHPGGGIPLVVQSALNAAELIDRYEI